MNRVILLTFVNAQDILENGAITQQLAGIYEFLIFKTLRNHRTNKYRVRQNTINRLKDRAVQ